MLSPDPFSVCLAPGQETYLKYVVILKKRINILNQSTHIHAFRHLYIVCMHILCTYFFVRIVTDFLLGHLIVWILIWNCVCVCACVRACLRACVCVCLPLSLLFFPNIVHFCCLWTLFADDYLVYYKHYHNTGIKHNHNNINKNFILFRSVQFGQIYLWHCCES